MTLDTWEAADQLYLARGDEISPFRPVFTGDVFDSLLIPGLDNPGAAMVVAHPCSMRGPSAKLVDRILMAMVGPHDAVPARKWADGYFDRLPLPDLRCTASSFAVAWLGRVGLVKSENLHESERVACLSSVGVNILQQRLVFNFTRTEVPTAKFWEAFAHTYEEADLLEEWTEAFAELGMGPDDTASSFDVWIKGESRQERLKDPQQRAPLRSEMRREIARTTR